MIDLNNDKKPELLILEAPTLYVFEERESGWSLVNNAHLIEDANDQKAFAEGRLSTAKTAWNDLVVGDTQMPVN